MLTRSSFQTSSQTGSPLLRLPQFSELPLQVTDTHVPAFQIPAQSLYRDAQVSIVAE